MKGYEVDRTCGADEWRTPQDQSLHHTNPPVPDVLLVGQRAFRGLQGELRLLVARNLFLLLLVLTARLLLVLPVRLLLIEQVLAQPWPASAVARHGRRRASLLSRLRVDERIYS